MLLMVVLIVGAAAAVLLVQFVGLANDRARARTAADAAALAAAAAPADAVVVAAEVARRNGGVLEVVTVEGEQAEVTVRVGRARASARAASSWVRAGPRRREIPWTLRPGSV